MEQVAVARSQVVAAVPGVLGVKLVVLPAVTSASVIVPVKAWQAPVPSGPAGTLMSDWAAATAEFTKALASDWPAPSAERLRTSCYDGSGTTGRNTRREQRR